MGEGRPIAVAFNRIGPYHHARLCAVAKKLPLLALEGCDIDRTYLWDKVQRASEYPVRTLFDSGDCEEQRPSVVRQAVFKVLNEMNPAIVVAPGWASKLALSLLDWAMTSRKPAVVLSDSTMWDEKRTLFRECIKKRIISCFSSGFVAGTAHADYIMRLGMRSPNVALGYDVIDNDYFRTGAEKSRKQQKERKKQKAKTGKEFCLPENYFLASARFVRKKNLSRLVEAYVLYRGKKDSQRPRSTAKTEAPWFLVILGDGPLRGELKRQVAEAGLQNYVLMPGFKQYDELPVYYGLASVFVHASTTEQWGLVVNEAMASGLPVLVSSRCGCAQDLVHEGVNGFTFDPYNVEQLAELMLKVSASSCPLSALGSASCEIISHWGLDRFANGLQQAVEIGLTNPRPRERLLDRLLLRLLLLR
jgi:glycosyltransferase involved in cell wall biosynthesis